jgi:hypothetical protein
MAAGKLLVQLNLRSDWEYLIPFSCRTSRKTAVSSAPFSPMLALHPAQSLSVAEIRQRLLVCARQGALTRE